MIWFTLLLFAVSFFASVLLAPKPELENARPGKLGDIQWPIASEGTPIPVIFGKVRIRNPNCIWYGDYKTNALKKKVKTGVFSSERVTVGYRYHVGFDLALCCGPGVRLTKIWVEKKTLWQSGIGAGPGQSLVSISAGNIFGGSKRGGGFAGTAYFYGGEFDQVRNSYLGVAVEADVPAYVGVAHIVFQRPYIGTSPQLRPLSFQVERYPDNLGLDPGDLEIDDDLNPMEILYSALTEEWGGINADPTDIDTASWITAGATLATEGNGMSLLISNINTGKSIAEEVLRQIDGILYQDPATGKIKVKLIREDYDIGSLLHFDESNLLGVQDFSRTSWAETFNQVRVKFTNRNKKYETSTAFVQDMANINVQGRVRSASYSFPGCTKGILAVTLATRELAQGSVPLFRATLLVNREALQLRPGDPFLWSWAPYGLSEVVMRVQRFSSGTQMNGQVVMEVIQDQFAASTVLYDSVESLWDEVDRTAVDITDYAVFECPYWILQQLNEWLFDIEADKSYLWGLARDPGLMQTYDMATSDDVFVSDIVASINQPNFTPSAKLASRIPFVQGQPTGIIDKIIITDVDPEQQSFDWTWQDDKALDDTEASDIRSRGDNLMVIGGEIFSYEDFNHLGNGVYELLTVYRALLDTQFETHEEDDVVWFLNGVDWLGWQDPRDDVDIIYYKFISYSDQDGQDIGDVTMHQITTNQRYDRPAPPDKIYLDGTRCPIQIVGLNAFDITAFTRRDRTYESIQLYNDSGSSEEVGTTYTARFYLDDVLINEQTGLTYASLPISFTGLSGVGIGRVELTAVLSTLESWTADFVQFWFAYYPNLSSELVNNGSFESSIVVGWTIVDGGWQDEGTDYPLEPIVTLDDPTAEQHGETKLTGDHELTQSVNVTSYQGQAAIFRTWKGALDDTVGSQIKIELIQSPSTVLDTLTTPLTTPTWGEWEMIEFPISISSNTDEVKITLLADAAGATFDEVSLKANSVSVQTAEKYDNLTGLTILGAWGLRQMDSGYSGALVRVRDTFDDSEFDVGQDEDGNLEMFMTMGEARVVRLYDQSGNGCHLDPITEAEQPLLRYGTSPTGRPFIKFTAGETLRDITAAGTSLPYMVARPNMSLVIGPRDTEGNDYIAIVPHEDGAHTTPYYRWGMTTGSNDWRFRFNDASRVDAGAGDPDTTLSVFFADAQNGALYHNDDGTAVDTWTAADTTWPNDTRVRIAETAIGSLPWDGEFYELCIFSGNISAGDRQTIMEDLGDYWLNISV